MMLERHSRSKASDDPNDTIGIYEHETQLLSFKIYQYSSTEKSRCQYPIVKNFHADSENPVAEARRKIN
jgi:hypothetical protein